MWQRIPWTALLLFVCLLAAQLARAAQLYVVWTSEVGLFAPLWVTKEAKLLEKYGK